MSTTLRNCLALGLFALVTAPGVMADSNCGMNSNKACPPDKLIAKEPANPGMNSNQAQEKDSLSGVSASDLKVQPKARKTSRKERAD